MYEKKDCIPSTISRVTTSSRIFFFSVGSYFALQWLANFLVAATALGQNCVQSETANTVLFFMNTLVSGGLSVIGTNILCHRYLVEKARVVIG
jgi:nitrate reductase gamma subunit